MLYDDWCGFWERAEIIELTIREDKPSRSKLVVDSVHLIPGPRYINYAFNDSENVEREWERDREMATHW